jgi:hypothetical protein
MPALKFIAQATVFNNQMFTLQGYAGENSTYHLQFRAPRFQCTTAQYNSTLLIDYKLGRRIEAPTFATVWDRERLIYSSKQYNIANYTVQRDLNSGLVWNANCVIEEQICMAQSVHYDVNVTFPRGVQTVSYSLGDAKVPLTQIDILRAGSEFGLQIELPPEAKAFQDWYRELSRFIPASNEWAILDALGTLIEGTSFHLTSTPSLLLPLPGYPSLEPPLEDGTGSTCQQREGSFGPTPLYDCGPWYSGYNSETEHCTSFQKPSNNTAMPETKKSAALLKGTVFHTARFNRQQIDFEYDPRESLNITEAMLNEVLTNITMSAISLGTWWDMVPVTSTRYRSTYMLSNPLNLILPYSICLAAATVFMAIAIWCLWRNRAPAVDGGFLQIMMATVGDTQMGRVILGEKMAAIGDMSDELKSLRIRYGELINEDIAVGGKRFGFGTVEETVSLRKRR